MHFANLPMRVCVMYLESDLKKNKSNKNYFAQVNTKTGHEKNN
jgi:hypothetical protein